MQQYKVWTSGERNNVETKIVHSNIHLLDGFNFQCHFPTMIMPRTPKLLLVTRNVYTKDLRNSQAHTGMSFYGIG